MNDYHNTSFKLNPQKVVNSASLTITANFAVMSHIEFTYKQQTTKMQVIV